MIACRTCAQTAWQTQMPDPSRPASSFRLGADQNDPAMRLNHTFKSNLRLIAFHEATEASSLPLTARFQLARSYSIFDQKVGNNNAYEFIASFI